MKNPKFIDITLEKDFQDSYTQSKRVPKLLFGKQKIVISNEELNKLESIYNKYIERNGVALGFVNYLLRFVV